jgi:hypothetical protein
MPAEESPQQQESRPPVAPDSRRALGRLGEDVADGHFRRLGFAILGRNVRTRAGEIDLIAFDGRTLVFAEVVADYRPWPRSTSIRRSTTRRKGGGGSVAPGDNAPREAASARQASQWQMDSPEIGATEPATVAQAVPGKASNPGAGARIADPSRRREILRRWI